MNRGVTCWTKKRVEENLKVVEKQVRYEEWQIFKKFDK
jgi:hypothetical protein